jgi:imidazolonepropionase-like amidohydrolase
MIIKNVNLIDGTGADVRENVSIAIEGKLIGEIGKDVSGTEKIIDAKGKWAIPGMMDLHVHLNNPPYQPVRELRMFLEAGFTTIAGVGGMLPFEGVALKNAIEDGSVQNCARLLPGGVVAATNGHVKGYTADGPWEVRKNIRKAIEERAFFIKTASSGGFWAEDEECWWVDYTYEELAALVDEAHSMGRKVMVHAHSQPGINNAIKAGADQIHHGAFIDDEALDMMAEKKIDFVPTLRVTSQENIDIKNKAERPWEARKMAEAHDIHREGVRKALKTGIRIGLGTDLPSSPPWRAGQSAVELEYLVECGMTPMQAIMAATKNSAEIMGIDDRLGTIENGKTADLILVDKNPLENISVLTDPDNIKMVIKDGKAALNS